MKRIEKLAFEHAKKNCLDPDEHNNYANAFMFGYEAALEDAANAVCEHEVSNVLVVGCCNHKRTIRSLADQDDA